MPDSDAVTVTITVPGHIVRNPHPHAHQLVDIVVDAITEAGRSAALDNDFGDHSDEVYVGGNHIDHYVDPEPPPYTDLVAGRRRTGIGSGRIGLATADNIGPHPRHVW